MNASKPVGTLGILGTRIVVNARDTSPSAAKTVGMGAESKVPTLRTNDREGGDVEKTSRLSDVSNVPTIPNVGEANLLNWFLRRWSEPYQPTVDMTTSSESHRRSFHDGLGAERLAELGELPELRDIANLLAVAYRRYGNAQRTPVSRAPEVLSGGVALSVGQSVHGVGRSNP